MKKIMLGLLSVFCLSLVTGCNKNTSSSSSIKTSSSSSSLDYSSLTDEEYFNNFDPVLRFSVASDIHIQVLKTPEEEKMAKMMQMAYAHARNSESDHKTLDALLIAGDLMENGEDNEFFKFTEIFYENIDLDETYPFITLGNHEFEFRNDGDPIEMFTSILDCEEDEHTVINGYHFIRLCPSVESEGHAYSEEKQEWLLEELNKAKEDTPDKPIFVLNHHAVLNTVYGTENTTWGSNSLKDVLSQFPQVVNFTGHSHYSMCNPKSIHQKDFTGINVGPMAYFSLALNDYKKEGVYPIDREGGFQTSWTRGTRAGEFAVCEVDARGAMKMFCYDVISEELLCTYTFRDLVNKENFKTNEQKEIESKVGEFKEGSELAIVDITKNTCRVEIPVAESEDFIESYRVYIYDEKDVLIKKAYALSGEIFRPIPEQVYANIEGLSSNTNYKLEVYAVNAYNKISETPLEIEISTL